MPEDSEGTEEARLAMRAADGDEAALSILYRRYADLLFAFIHHRMGDRRTDAEDVFQDTWLAAMRSLATYRRQKPIFFWLCGIARHKIADSVSYQFRGSKYKGFTGEDRQASELSLNEILDDAPLPADVVEDMETRTRVIEAMALLPGDYRAALRARYLDDLSVEEIAAQLGRTYKATESLLSRARAAMRDAMGSAERESEDA